MSDSLANFFPALPPKPNAANDSAFLPGSRCDAGSSDLISYSSGPAPDVSLPVLDSELLDLPYCYDIDKTWAENLASGLPQRCSDLPPAVRVWAPENKWITFLGHKLASPLGVAAGPLLSSQWVALAACRGFDCLTYKTIRSHAHAGHGLPNILRLQADTQLMTSGPGSHSPLRTLSLPAATAATAATHTSSSIPNNSANNSGGSGCSTAAASALAAPSPPAAVPAALAPLCISNSFGMPSQAPELVVGDVAAARRGLAGGQLLVVSVTGTPDRPGSSFLQDLGEAARTALRGGASALEVNLSCPNVGGSHVALYQDTPAVEATVAGLREIVGGDVPLLVKVGAFQDPEGLRRMLVAAERAGAAAVAGINGLSRRVEDAGGGPALGPARPTSGVCGDPIRSAGLGFVEQARQVITSHGLRMGLVGVGGVTQADHVMQYLKAGADVVQSATGFMWRPHLGTDFQRMWAETGFQLPIADGRGGRE